ncbi:MAG: 2-C-methyl-D-erythritol 4-phosphate cytidylyltransferase [Nitrospirota bacterium]|nr:2-C-methyl-D-erythritol 4-phosphate cytidylyltransferase [Nitrospirota bacterium]
MKTDIIAIVPAAGMGKRFDPSIIKTFAELEGAPLLVHTLKRLHREASITEIIPVLRQQDIEKGLKMAKDHKLDKIKRIAEGGRERQDSIYNALNLLERSGTGNDKLVLIHDGARPFIPEGTIEKLAEGLKAADGAIPGIPVRDTLKQVDDNGIAVSTLDRERIRAVQTPQLFSFSTLKKAYDKAYREGHYATDDAALVERNGGRIKIINGSPYNIKITTPEDLDMIRHVLSGKK